jgi:CRISPR-associated protein Csc1
MHIYWGTLELLDYVFFATVERGKVYESGGFIHNYALAYALRLAQAPYAHLIQEPRYASELAPLNEAGLYLTPAAPLRLEFRLVQWNTIRESYDFPGKIPSIGYPDWGFARVLRPESSFTFYLLMADPALLPMVPTLQDLLAGRSARIRLGKFPGKARITLSPADRIVASEGSFTASPLLNWRDFSSEPSRCDILPSTLPTRLILNAHFPSGRYYESRFGQERVFLPDGMRFLARPFETENQRKRKAQG